MSHSYNPPDKIDYVLRLPIFKSVQHRLPWLVIGLFGGILASGVVNFFEEIIKKNLILAAFIPLLVYMSDAVGTQMESFAIRDLAIHKQINLVKYTLKHLLVTAIIGSILAILLGAFTLLFYTDLRLSLALSIAMFISICSSVLTGIILPVFFRKENQDPANASGPVATIVQDLLSILIYFTIASALLK